MLHRKSSVLTQDIEKVHAKSSSIYLYMKRFRVSLFKCDARFCNDFMKIKWYPEECLSESTHRPMRPENRKRHRVQCKKYTKRCFYYPGGENFWHSSENLLFFLFSVSTTTHFKGPIYNSIVNMI
jgi:hypothetical protein